MSSLRLRRAGVIGDVHAEDEALAAVLAFLQNVPDLDALLCTGDIVTGPGDAGRCCRLLREAGVLTVRGNHDRWFFTPGYADQIPLSTPDEEVQNEDRAFLAGLPATRAFDTPLGPLLLCHGVGRNDMNGVYPRDTHAVLAALHQLHAIYSEGQFRLLVCGHTHQRMVRAFDHLTIFNAGTLRQNRNPCFFVADFEAGWAECYNLSEAAQQMTPADVFALPAPPQQQ